MRRLSQPGARFIAGEEGTRLKRYSNDGGSGGGNCTVGVGHLLHLGPCDGRPGEFDLPSAEAAWDLLMRDMDGSYVPAVNGLISVPLNQNQFDALVSFTFNVGTGGLQTSTLRRRLNAGDYGSVCTELRKWVRGRRSDQQRFALVYDTYDPFAEPYRGSAPWILDPERSSSFAVADSDIIPGLVNRRERECRLFNTPSTDEPPPPLSRSRAADLLILGG